MNDSQLIQHISELVDEETQLRAHPDGEGRPDPARLKHLEEQLDQCWDLLRQRRALRETGGDPGGAAVRPADEVEGYIG